MNKTSSSAPCLPSNLSDYLPINWPDYRIAESPLSTTVPAHRVHAFCTLRTGGYSKGDFSAFNLATQVSDDVNAVSKNRRKLRNELKLPAEPIWLDQRHSSDVYRINKLNHDNQCIIKADASTTDEVAVVCAVLTADCLPVFICNRSATEVAVVHAGWRGLHQGIISKTVQAMRSAPENLLVSLGPAIGPQAFEVGEEVYSAFIEKSQRNKNAFKKSDALHFLCDIYQLARNECQQLGIKDVTGGEYCTYSDTSKFYSYRKKSNTGRMASLIWMQ